MRGASVLYLKQRFIDPGKRLTAIAAKTFEYLATGLPILAEVPEGDNADMVRAYATAAEIVSENSVPEMSAALTRLSETWRDREPVVSQAFQDRYSRMALTRRLAQIMDNVAGGSAADCDVARRQ